MSLSLDKNGILEKINKVSGLAELETLRIQYLGKKGLLTSEMKSLSLLSIKEKKGKGQKLNIFATGVARSWSVNLQSYLKLKDKSRSRSKTYFVDG